MKIPLNINFFGTELGPFVTIVGILPWPIVFLLTDLLNEFYGYKAVKKVELDYCNSHCLLFYYCWSCHTDSCSMKSRVLLCLMTIHLTKCLGQAQMVIVGSICAFLVSQLLDAVLFKWIKSRTGSRYIWLRSTGSTVGSQQLIDSYIVLYIGFVLPGSLTFSDFMTIAPTNYILKMNHRNPSDTTYLFRTSP